MHIALQLASVVPMPSSWAPPPRARFALNPHTHQLPSQAREGRGEKRKKQISFGFRSFCLVHLMSGRMEISQSMRVFPFAFARCCLLLQKKREKRRERRTQPVNNATRPRRTREEGGTVASTPIREREKDRGWVWEGGRYARGNRRSHKARKEEKGVFGYSLYTFERVPRFRRRLCECARKLRSKCRLRQNTRRAMPSQRHSRSC